jgi:hypothetical protein
MIPASQAIDGSELSGLSMPTQENDVELPVQPAGRACSEQGIAYVPYVPQQTGVSPVEQLNVDPKLKKVSAILQSYPTYPGVH